MTNTSKVTSRGRVTIPKEIREQMGLKKSDRVEFVFDRGRLVLRRVPRRENLFDEYVGAYPCFKGVREINAWVREMRDRRDKS